MSLQSQSYTSVIIPARNAAETIAQTLDSLLAQSHCDWEAILIDDGSVDETAAIMAFYAAKDDRFLLLSGTGQGVSVARNTGLARATGKRLLFLDSDDWVEDSFLAEMNQALDLCPEAVAAYCSYRRVMPGGEISQVYGEKWLASAPFEAFARSCAIAIHAVLVETAAVVEAGGFDTALRTCEDWDLWQRIARCGRPWAFVDKAMSYYRASDRSLTQDVGRMLADARIVIYRGFSSDPRVGNAAPVHQAGACADGGRGPENAFGYFSLWCAAFDCGRGRQGVLEPSTLAPLCGSPGLETSVTHVLFDGVLVGLRQSADRIASRWQQFGPAVMTLILSLSDHGFSMADIRNLQRRFEKFIFDCETPEARAEESQARRGPIERSSCLVSVVIPAYNAEGTIDETLRSVRAQTHEHLEILIVDDGSTDRTGEIAKAHAASDHRIRVISQQNAGVAEARNLGWRLARADAIAFVDADDLWSADKIERQLEALLSGGDRVGLVYTWFAEIDEQSRIFNAVASGAFTGNVLDRMLIGNLVGNGSSALVRRRALVEVAGFDAGLQDAGAHGCEDFQFYFRVATRCEFELVPDYLTGYRILSQRMSSDRPRMLKSWLLVAEEMKRMCPNRAGLVDEGFDYYVSYLIEDAYMHRELKQIRKILEIWRSHAPAANSIKRALLVERAWVRSIRRRIHAFKNRRSGVEHARFQIGEPTS